MESSPSKQSALAAWRAAIGAPFVIPLTIGDSRGTQATFGPVNPAWASVRPGSRAELRAVLRIASDLGVSVYPVSRGMNWGFGSAVPVEAGCALLDLSRLDQITAFHERHAYMVVEPGVTFAQACEFLNRNGSRLSLSIPGTSPHASVLGNVLERGHGCGLYADRANYACDFEVYLSTGETVRTGFSRFPNARAAHVARWGPGPSLDGLLCQSNFGVVTEGTIWLTPKPGSAATCEFSLSEQTRLPNLASRLGELRLGGVIRSPVVLWNDLKLLSVYQRYPWERMCFQTPLSRPVRSAVCRDRQIGAWTGWFSVPGLSRELVSAEAKAVVAEIQGLLDSIIVKVDGVPVICEGTETCHGALDAGGLLGVPSESSVRAAYWRKRTDPRGLIDLDRDLCGKITCSVAAPFCGEALSELVELAEGVFVRHGFDPIISFISTSERVVQAIAFILYDREQSGEDGRAVACQAEYFSKASKRGFVPDRLAVNGMTPTVAGPGDYASVLRRLKAVFDPTGVISPGRYGISNGPEGTR